MLKDLTKKEIRRLKLNELIKDINYELLISKIQHYYMSNYPNDYQKYNTLFCAEYLKKVINDIASDFLGKMKQSVSFQADSFDVLTEKYPTLNAYIEDTFASKIDYEILYLVFHGRLLHKEAVFSYDEIEKIINSNRNSFAEIAEKIEKQIIENVELTDNLKSFLPSLIFDNIHKCLSVYKDTSFIDLLNKYLYTETTASLALMKYLS